MNGNEQSDTRQSLRNLIDSLDTAMLTTVGLDGRLESRPMATQGMDAAGALWFFASRRSPWSRSLADGDPVNIAYMDVGAHRYVSVTGEATLVDDREQSRVLWKPALSAWFPGGFADPDIQLIRIRIAHADSWSSPSHVVTRLTPGSGGEGRLP